MPRITYVPKNFQAKSETVIHQANTIIAEYQAQGFQLTLRQLYYQFVSRDLIPNQQKEYDRLGSIINDARLAGRIDWEAIVDRTRNLEDLAHWASPQDIVRAISRQYRTERWADQPRRVEVWIEKDALVGVIEDVCESNDIPYFSCRGYTSQSEVWAAGQRLGGHLANGQAVTILHLGDHDPSGKDMTRDIEDRLQMFITQDWLNAGHMGSESYRYSEIFKNIEEHIANSDNGDALAAGRPPLEIQRIALNWDQVEQYQPPPNPAKLTDSRARKYIDEFGDESWELDALEPAVLAGLIQNEVDSILDFDRWETSTSDMEEQKDHLRAVSHRWNDVVEFLRAAS